MFLAFHISDIITIPFGYLLDWLYQFTSNYGIALILFAILVKLLLFPIQAKSKKSMMKMSRLSPLVQKIQARYPDDQQKQNEALQQLYKDEGVSMTGGCLWSFVPLLILLPLYQVVRQPIVYMLHESLDVAEQIIEIIKAANSEYFGGNPYYHQMVAARYLPEFAEAIKEAIPSVSANTLAGLNFDFLGIDLGAVPQFNVFRWTTWDWAHIGAFLIPILSAGSQVLSMFISQKMNDSVITNEKGVQDKETAKNSQQNQTNMIMMWMMPLMSLWIGFTVPAALSLYWFIQGIISIVQDVFLTQHYRKIYDAEDAVKREKAAQRAAEEAEKERIRAAKRAANPDGITENTSKKKQQLREKQNREAAAKDYEAKKRAAQGLAPEEAAEILGGEENRPYARGRAYRPDHYHSDEE